MKVIRLNLPDGATALEQQTIKKSVDLRILNVHQFLMV